MIPFIYVLILGKNRGNRGLGKLRIKGSGCFVCWMQIGSLMAMAVDDIM